MIESEQMGEMSRNKIVSRAGVAEGPGIMLTSSSVDSSSNEARDTNMAGTWHMSVSLVEYMVTSPRLYWLSPTITALAFQPWIRLSKPVF